VDYSDEQVDAAMERAQQKMVAQGKHIDSLNSPDFNLFFRQMAAELGCRLPEGDAPTFGTSHRQGPSPTTSVATPTPR